MRIRVYCELGLLVLGGAVSLKGAPIFFEKANQRSERGSLYQNVEQETLYRRRQAEMDESRRDSSFPHENSETSSESRVETDKELLKEELARLYEQVERAAQEWKEHDSSLTSIEEKMQRRSKVESAIEDLLDEKDFYDAQTGEEFENKASVNSLGEREIVAEKSVREVSDVKQCQVAKQEFGRFKAEPPSNAQASLLKKITKESSSISRITKTLLGYLACSSMLQQVGADLVHRGLIAHYPFDANNPNHVTWNKNDGAASAVTPAPDCFGVAEKPCSVNGASSYVEVMDGSPFNMNNKFALSLLLKPGSQASSQGSDQPCAKPTIQESSIPSTKWNLIPTAQPSEQPSLIRMSHPTVLPSLQSSVTPTSQPRRLPSSQPSAQLTAQPSLQITSQPTSISGSQNSESSSSSRRENEHSAETSSSNEGTPEGSIHSSQLSDEESTGSEKSSRLSNRGSKSGS